MEYDDIGGGELGDHQLEYDHNSNSELELLGGSDADPDDLFTFNNHEIYITDPHDRDFNEDYDLGDNQVNIAVKNS